MIWGARASVRAALSLAMLVAMRHNSVIRGDYECLLATGKNKKVVLMACIRTLLTF
jgi:transposase